MSTPFKLVEHDQQTGVTTTVHGNELGGVTIQKTYDPTEMLRQAEAARQQTEGQRWGEMRHIGFIPNAVLGQFMRQDGGIDKPRLRQWLRENPAFCTFTKALK